MNFIFARLIKIHAKHRRHLIPRHTSHRISNIIGISPRTHRASHRTRRTPRELRRPEDRRALSIAIVIPPYELVRIAPRMTRSVRAPRGVRTSTRARMRAE